MSAFGIVDLENLNHVYWEMQEKGTEWGQHRDSLARIYYACEEALYEQDIVCDAQAVAVNESEHSVADLTEEDTTLVAQR